MMYIDKSLDRIIKAEQLHYSGLIDQLYERIDSKITDPKSVQLFDFFINPFLDIIINGSPSEIIKFSKEINLIANEKFIDDIKSVFQYKGWFDQKKENTL